MKHLPEFTAEASLCNMSKHYQMFQVQHQVEEAIHPAFHNFEHPGEGDLGWGWKEGEMEDILEWKNQDPPCDVGCLRLCNQQCITGWRRNFQSTWECRSDCRDQCCNF